VTGDIGTLDTVRLIKVSIAWITILYVLCFVAVALFPAIRPLFMQYTLHADVSMGPSVITWQTFVAGLVFWNIAAAIGFGGPANRSRIY
jgi:hypothetical protein